MPELAAVAVGDRRVAHVVVARGQLPRGPLEEQRGGGEGAFQHLARGADVVGRQQPVLPGERRRVAGVVEQRRPHVARVARDPCDEQGVVGGDVGVVAGGEAPRVGIPEIAVRRQRAAPVTVGHPGRLECGDRLLDRCADLIREAVEVGPDQLDARLVAELGVGVRAGVGVRHADQQ